MVSLCCFFQTLKGNQTGIYSIDATTIAACHPKRADRNKVFRGLAKKSKSTMGWYFGFKLHLVINDKGELIAFKVTSSTTDDRHSVVDLARSLSGKLFGDKGYISQLEYTRQRSPVNFMVKSMSLALLSHMLSRLKKPSINITQSQMKLLKP